MGVPDAPRHRQLPRPRPQVIHVSALYVVYMYLPSLWYASSSTTAAPQTSGNTCICLICRIHVSALSVVCLVIDNCRALEIRCLGRICLICRMPYLPYRFRMPYLPYICRMPYLPYMSYALSALHVSYAVSELQDADCGAHLLIICLTYVICRI